MHEYMRLVFADGGNRLHEPLRQVEPAAFPIARKILRAAINRTVALDFSRTPDSNKGRELQVRLFSDANKALEHSGDFLDGFVAFGFVFAVAPNSPPPNRDFRQIVGLFRVQLHDTGADIRAANIDGENGVLALEDPSWGQVDGPDEAGVVRIVPDRRQGDFDVVGFQQQLRPA